MKRFLLALIGIIVISIPIYASENITLYTTTRVNFRSSPEITQDNIINTLDINTPIIVVYDKEYNNNEWTYCKVRDENGFVYTECLSEEEILMKLLGNYKVTGYRMFAASENGGRSDGMTASGVIGEPGRTVAMKDIDFGTKIYIEGLGEYIVEDRGVGSGVVDVACYTTEECYSITGYYEVYIVEE